MERYLRTMQRYLSRISEMLKDNVYREITTFGFKYTPRMYTEGIEMWYHLRHLFSNYDVSCVIDVGANDGQYRNFLRRRCGYGGLIISFEPIREVFEMIKKRAEFDPNWMVYNIALGSSSGQKIFNVMHDTHFSSFLEPLDSEGVNLDIVLKNITVRRKSVEIRTLDEMLSEISRVRSLGRIYLKLDTQGYDFEVLKGASAELKNIVALQTEVPVKPLYKGMVMFSDAIDKLKCLGYDITGCFPVGRDKYLRVVEFDLVALNIKLANSIS